MYILNQTSEGAFVREIELVHPGHCIRVAGMTALVHEKIPNELRASGHCRLATLVGCIDLGSIIRFALLHDIGKLEEAKLYTENEIFDTEKKSRLREHCLAGYYLVKAGGGPDKLARHILFHHERWDGNGYFGLNGRDIPIPCRLLAILDTYDVIRIGRPYSPPKSHKEAKQELLAGCGSQFDPRLTPCALQVIEKAGLDSAMNFKKNRVEILEML